ncbi:MAG: DUF1761 domain-containing protein [Aggregatilineales bacterium]
MPTPELNIVAILIAAAVEVVIGAVWFNAPFAFNKPWLAGIGKTAEQVAEDASPISIVAAIVGALITALILAIFLQWMGVDTLINGALVGVLIALGFSANTAFIKDRFETRPVSLSLINAGHDVVILGLMGAILGAF